MTTPTEQPEAIRLADALAYCDNHVASRAAAELRRLHAVEVEADRTERNRDMWKAQCHSQASELENLRARLDRAIKAAEEHFGEDAIRYKLSLFKNGRASNYFPQEFDGRWFAFQRADNDAHVGLCDRIKQLESEREADRALMREALEALEAICGWQADQGHHRAAISKLRARVGES